MAEVRYYLQGHFVQGYGVRAWQNIDGRGHTGRTADRGYPSKAAAIRAAQRLSRNYRESSFLRVVVRPLREVVWEWNSSERLLRAE